MKILLEFHHAGPAIEVLAPNWEHLPRVGDWIDLSPDGDQGNDSHGYVRRIYFLGDRIVLVCGDRP